MEWSQDAEKALSRVPFFVRKKVKQRIETDARENGLSMVSIDDVNATRKRFLSSMDSNIKGYQIESCFSQGKCPNTCVSKNTLLKRVEALLKKQDLLEFLRKRVKGKLKFHHEFRISISECPNSCSQPQIKDIGIVSVLTPRLSMENCVACRACVIVCKEKAVTLTDEPAPVINQDLCVSCGACIRSCPSKTIEEGHRGYRILLGGRLGRHPQLARAMAGLYSEDRVIDVVQACLELYKERSAHGERFSTLLTDEDIERFNSMFT